MPEEPLGETESRTEENNQQIRELKLKEKQIQGRMREIEKEIEEKEREIEEKEEMLETTRQEQETFEQQIQFHRRREHELLKNMLEIQRDVIQSRRHFIKNTSERVDALIKLNVSRALTTSRKRRRVLLVAGGVMLVVAGGLGFIAYRHSLLAGGREGFWSSILVNMSTEFLVTGLILIILESLLSVWESSKDNLETLLQRMLWDIDREQIGLMVDETQLQDMLRELEATQEAILKAEGENTQK